MSCGHVENNESIVDAVIREMKEETELTIQKPKLCGTNEFTGNVTPSDKGEMQWIHKSELANQNIVNDLPELLQVMPTEDLTEVQYVIENGLWNNVIK